MCSNGKKVTCIGAAPDVETEVSGTDGWMHACICFGSVRSFFVLGLFEGKSGRIFVWWVWDELGVFPVMETAVDRMAEEAVAEGKHCWARQETVRGAFS